MGKHGQPLSLGDEKTVVAETHVIPAPEGIDPAVGVVLASAITGMSLRTAGGLQAGETVLIQGATGASGRLAVQVARLLGAGRIVATGRSDEALRQVGADAVINTAVEDEALRERFSAERYDVVLDSCGGGRPRSCFNHSCRNESSCPSRSASSK